MNSRVLNRLSLAVAFVVAILCGTRGTASADYAPHELPDLVGWTLDDAVHHILTHLPTHPHSRYADTDESRPYGTILRQTPAPGVLRYDAPIQLVVNTRAEDVHPVMVPEVVGQTETQARRTVTLAGLTVVRASSPGLTDRRDVDAVVRTQAPRAGTMVWPGTTVRLALRWDDPVTGPDARQVPNVVGRAPEAARAAVSAADLTPIVDVRRSGSPAVVRRQSPAAGTWIRKDAAVYLAVEPDGLTLEGDAPTQTVPNVMGRPQAEAESMIRAAHLVPMVLRRFGATRDTVVLQSPVAGLVVVGGSRVRITIESPLVAPFAPIPGAPVLETPRTEPPAATVIVPSVLGMRRSGALSVLRGAGLTARFVPDLATGAVTGQSPAAGTRVAPGSEVRVTLR